MIRLLMGFLLLVVMMVFGGSAVAADSAMYHFSGRVVAFEDQKITVDQRQFYVAPRCSFERHSKRNGAFFVDKASARNVYVGNNVTVRVNGTIVDQIMIEEWKR